jgi:parallel beta-helix repeat protein
MSNDARIRLKAKSRLEYGIITNRNAYMGDVKTDTGIRIIGGTIDGNSEVPSSGENRGIFLCKSSQSVIENVTVKDTIREGIRIHSIDEKGHSDHSVVRFCNVIRRQATVENILISTHLDDPKNRTGKVAATRYARVEGCYSSGGSHGIAFSNVRFAVAVNNVCEGNTHRGIILSPTCEDCLVTGNIVVNAGSTGIHLAYNSKRCVISNNIVRGTVADGSKFGIEGQGIKAYAGFLNLIITGNQVSSNATDGIALEGGGESKDYIISNNISSLNKRDGIRIFAGNITLGKSYDISNGAISGNICNENRESGIRLGTDHSSVKTVSISITGNSLSRNGKWGIHGDASKGVSRGTNNYDFNKLGDENVKDSIKSPDV